MDERCTSVICAEDDSLIRCDLAVTAETVKHEHEHTSDPWAATIVWDDEEACGHWPAPACGHQKINPFPGDEQ